MGRYRIGNDMTVVWSIYDHTGAAYNLKGKEVRLYYTCERGRFEVDFEIQETNKVVWSFFGREQKVIGDYTLSLEIIESAGKRRISKDYCNAFTLVGKSCEEAALGNPNISEDGNIVLSSKLDVYKIQPIIPTVGSNSNWFVDGTDTGKPSTGKSAYEYAKEKGYEGTESEYAESLKLAPENSEKLAELESEQEINTSWIKNTAYELAINQIVKFDGLELSDYIYLNGRKIIITSDSVGGFGGVFFNKQFSAISCFETRNLNNAQIDVPQDAVWMRVTNNYYVGECTIKISKTTNISPISLQKIDFEKVNGYINVDGTFVSDFADYYTSDFFIIHKGDVVVVKANGTEGVLSTLSLYNEKREFVKSLANGSYNDLLYRAETNTEYLRFSARLSTINECRIIRQNQNPLVEVPFNLLIDEKYIASKENGRYYDMSLYEISQNIQAHAGDIISTQCYGMGDMVSLISEWRKDGSYVKTLIHGSKDGVISEYLVEHDMFFRICRRKAQGIKVYIQKNASKQDEQTSLLNKQLSAYAIQEYSQNERNVINTSIALCRPICIGDSLTEGVDDAHNGRIIHENYPYFLSRLLSTNVVNAGIAGSNPITWYNSERGYRNINFYEHDSMIMWFGTNGGLTDTIDEDTAGGNPDTYAETNTGYYCKIIEKAMQAHPDMVIVLCTIYISGGSVDTTNLVIHKIAEKYNCIIVDMSDLGNLQNTCPPYLHPTKGIHFGKAGNIFIANRINNELRKLFMQDYSLMEFGVSVME